MPKLVEVDDASSSESGEEVRPPSFPDVVFRVCRTPDCSRTVAVWAVYEEVNDIFPLEKGWMIPDTTNAAYEIRPVEGKGRGLFATRSIKDQEAIIRERPVVIVPQRHRMLVGMVDADNLSEGWELKEGWKRMELILLQLLLHLEPEDRKKYLELHNCKSPDECGPLSGICRTNALGAKFDESDDPQTYCAVCLNISYANHSCTPNAAYEFDSEDVMFSLIADRDIAAGEEITISYTSILWPRAQRREDLEQKYRFACACIACARPDAVNAVSDEHRKFLRETYKGMSSLSTWRTWVECPAFRRKSQAKRIIEAAEKFLRVAEKEGLPRRKWKRAAYTQVASLYGALCDAKNFKKMARLWVTVVDSEDEKDKIEHWIKDPATFPLWEFDHKFFEESSTRETMPAYLLQ